MVNSIEERVRSLDWKALHSSLDDKGYASFPSLLEKKECSAFIDNYDNELLYRSRIDMVRYRYGEGEYKYFQAPLPTVLQDLRIHFYTELAKAANRWQLLLGKEALYPPFLAEFIERCHLNKQLRSTPLILKYSVGGYNCLHQDLYGDVYFPFQVLIALNQREVDYTGGEFLLMEQRPRAQSRGTVITLEQGTGIIFPTRYRPVAGTRGFYQTTLRHGVSTITSGTRVGLGIIFHDAL